MDHKNNQMGSATAAHHQQQHQQQHQQPHQQQHQQHHPHDQTSGAMGLSSWHQTYTSNELLNVLMQSNNNSFSSLIKVNDLFNFLILRICSFHLIKKFRFKEQLNQVDRFQSQ